MSTPKLTVNGEPTQIHALSANRGPSVFEGDESGGVVRRTTPFAGSRQIQQAYDSAEVVFHWPLGARQPSEVRLEFDGKIYKHLSSMSCSSAFGATEVCVNLDRS